MTDGFYSRLARAQSKFGEAQLDEENRYDRYRYPSFGSVIKAARGPLTEEGISIIQELLEDDNREIAIGVQDHPQSRRWRTQLRDRLAPARGPRSQGR